MIFKEGGKVGFCQIDMIRNLLQGNFFIKMFVNIEKSFFYKFAVVLIAGE